MIREEDIREVRERTDLVELVGERVALRRKGRLWWGLCPFHQEKTPSFKVDPETGLFHCFGCGEGGDAFHFAMKVEGLDFVDAVRLLADRAHFELAEEARSRRGPSRNRLIQAHGVAQRHLAQWLLRGEEGARARDYLAGRGFHSDTARRFGLGWAPGGATLAVRLKKAGFSEDELVAGGLATRSEGGALTDRFRRRVMFPIRDSAGRVIAFGGRVIDDSEPKYLNSADTPIFRKSRVLYALDVAKEAIAASRTAIVVEGYTDAIAAHVAGMTNVVATLGTAFTEEHLRLLARFSDRVVLVFDADEAGMTAAERSLRFAGRYQALGKRLVSQVIEHGKMDVRVAVLPEGKDPADLVLEDIDAFQRAVQAAEPLVEFVLERRLREHDLTGVAGRLDAARDALQVVAGIDSPVAQQEYVVVLAGRLGLEPHTLQAELLRLVKPSQPAALAGHGPEVVDGSEAAVEREALAALVGRPELVALYADTLTLELFADPANRAVFGELLETPEARAEELAARLAGHPEAGAALAGALLSCQEADKLAERFEDILFRLKEFALGRQIDEAKARLLSAERAGQPIAEIQSTLWSLQQELHAWRRRCDGQDRRSGRSSSNE